MFLCELFKSNDYVSQRFVPHLTDKETEAKRNQVAYPSLESYHVVKPTQMRIFYLSGYGSFHYITLQSSVKFYFPRVVLPLSDTITILTINT